MKRALAILLLLLTLVNNVQLTLASHYCMGRAKGHAIALGHQALHCGMELKRQTQCASPAVQQAHTLTHLAAELGVSPATLQAHTGTTKASAAAPVKAQAMQELAHAASGQPDKPCCTDTTHTLATDQGPTAQLLQLKGVPTTFLAAFACTFVLELPQPALVGHEHAYYVPPPIYFDRPVQFQSFLI